MLFTRRKALGLLLAGCAPTGSVHAADQHSEGTVPKVTLSLDKAPLTTLVKELTQQTGVKHRVVGHEAKRPILVAYCRNQPATAVRKAAEELLGWTWTRENRNGETTYTLIKTVRAQQREQLLRARYAAQYREVLAGMLAAAADPNWKPRAGEALDQQITAEDTGSIFRCAVALPETVRNAILEGRPYHARAGLLQGAFGDAVRRAWSQMAAGRTLGLDDPIRLEVVRDATGRPDYFQLTIQRVELRAGHADFMYPDAIPVAQEEQAALQRLLETHPELSVRLAKQPPLKWPEPPDPEPSFMEWNLRDLSRRVERSFMADYYPSVDTEIERVNPKPFLPLAADGKQLSAVLEEITDPHYTLGLQDDWLIFRHRWWYWERARA